MPRILPTAHRVLPTETKQLPGPKRNPKPPTPKLASINASAMRFAPVTPQVSPKSEKPKREPRKKAKNDPKFVAAARELRDRWLEKVNTTPAALDCAKYEVSRGVTALPMLSAA